MTAADLETRLRASLQELTAATPLLHADRPADRHRAPSFGRRLPGRRVMAAAVVVIVVAGFGLALAYGPHSVGPVPERPAAQGPAPRFPLPSDGWKPGDPSLLALTGGVFQAQMTTRGACAWLGTTRTSFLWPAGYTVRFHPTELIDPRGHVVAHEGQRLYAGGGSGPTSGAAGTRCAVPGHPTWYVESALTTQVP